MDAGEFGRQCGTHLCWRIRARGQREIFHSVHTLYAPLFICLQGQGKRWFIWRDSCDEATYRQLLVRLKRELNGSRDRAQIS